MILALCYLPLNGKRSTNPTLFRVSNDLHWVLKQCTFSAQHIGASYPAYAKTDSGRLIVRMATYRGV